MACFLVAVGLLGRLVPTGTDEAQARRILLRNAGGRVVFTHADHAKWEDGNCMTCHHEPGSAAAADPKAAPKIGECGGCHRRDDDTHFAAAHQEKWSKGQDGVTCASCHHVIFAGLSDKWDHQAHFTFAGDDCQTCHHTADTEPEPQACANCHAPDKPAAKVLLRDAVHAKCEPCHADLFAQKLAGCQTCHEQKPAPANLPKGAAPENFPACSSCHTTMPSRMDSFHQSCIGCHDKKKAGPGSGSDKCKQCHTP